MGNVRECAHQCLVQLAGVVCPWRLPDVQAVTLQRQLPVVLLAFVSLQEQTASLTFNLNLKLLSYQYILTKHKLCVLFYSPKIKILVYFKNSKTLYR